MTHDRGTQDNFVHVDAAEAPATEQRYQMLLESSPVGIFHGSFTGELVYVNRKWCEIAGRSLQRITTPTWRSVIHPDDVDVAENQLRRAFETGADFEEAFRLLTPLGEIRWVSVRSVPLSVTDERSAGRLGTMEDVTERHGAQQALQRSEDLHRSVIETMTEGIYIQAADGHLIESNPASKRLLGTPSGDLRDVAVFREDGKRLTKRQFPRRSHCGRVSHVVGWWLACKIRSGGADG